MVIDETTIGPSGLPRYAEAARYWLPYIGVPDAAWVKDSTYTDYLNDIVCRGGGVNYLLDQGIKVDLSLALHTDAGAALNDSLIGTMAIYTHKEDKDYANYVLNQVVGDLQRAYTPLWPRRELRRANYGETRTPKVPAMILEALSHQNYADMRYALDPAFRQAVARAVYKGIGRYLADIHGTHFVPTPLAPKGLHTSFSGDSLVITWHAVTDTLEPEAVPEYYMVYLREDGRTWDGGTCVKTGRMALPVRSGVRYDVCVASGNTGGISLRSDIVSACLSATDTLPPLLVVDAFQEVRGPKMMAFDSLTGGIVPGARPIPDGYELAYIGEQINYNRLDPWHSDDDCGFGMCGLDKQGQLLVGNTHDYAACHGAVLQRLGRSYVSCTADALSEQDSVYEQIDIVLGKSGAEQVERLYDWVSRLGWAQNDKKVLISGANVGYPHYACTSGKVRMNGQTYTFRQEMNTDRLSAEDVSAVSKLTPNDTVIARYADTGLPAILQGTNYTVCGLPLETLDDFETIYQQLIIHL
ncbi:MAG: N-acetylmuramoyl-L-alanine amidase [Paludibacteraceae bacterium]|nr:N-acetylmuramoyl-L-alanine amidase [Paludibacteraceae bacterium]